MSNKGYHVRVTYLAGQGQKSLQRTRLCRKTFTFQAPTVREGIGRGRAARYPLTDVRGLERPLFSDKA